jgi:SOS response associated peptidase (SRAP)
MCGRVIQSSGPLHLAIVDGLDVSDSRLGNMPRRYNAAPSQELLVIRQNHKTGERSLDLLKWGLIPHWCSDPRGGRRPINAKAENVSRLPTFGDAYALRRCIVPVDGFFEWRAAIYTSHIIGILRYKVDVDRFCKMNGHQLSSGWINCPDQPDEYLQTGKRCSTNRSSRLAYSAASALWISATTAAPSPTAAATRLVDPDLTSPIAKTPTRLVSSGSAG